MAFRSLDESYEAFFRAHVDEFAGFLAGVLGSEADVRGGRAGVADVLQEAMLRILGEWGELEGEGDGDRARRLYRCLRDAAGEALRREHGRRDARRRPPRVLAYDFGALELDGEVLEPRERELTVAVLGAMVCEIAEDTPQAERRAMLDRGVLLAGLRALSEREAVVMIAVDRLGWEQRELAERLGLEFGRLRETLFTARKLFYGVVRHAVGVEIDETERARLHAYLAGELVGRDRRLARRHLIHCRACQALMREQRFFAQGARQLLAPLPFVIGAHALAKPATVKGAAVAGASAGVGLLGQAGAAKALAATVAVLGTGVGVNAWLSIRAEHEHAPVAAIAALPAPSGLIARLVSDSPPGHATVAGGSRGGGSPARHAKAPRRSGQQPKKATSQRPATTTRTTTAPPASTTPSHAVSVASTSTPSVGSSGPAAGEFGFEGR